MEIEACSACTGIPHFSAITIARLVGVAAVMTTDRSNTTRQGALAAAATSL